jgi:hypothetical protein
MWGLLADKGYQGADAFVRAYVPKKKGTKRLYSQMDEEGNSKLRRDRVIVENFYGRATSLWNVLREKWRWDHETFDMVQRVTYALTNFHISLHPLRAEDGDFYHKVIARYIAQGKERAEKEKTWRDTSKQRRKRRLEFSQREREMRFAQQ